MNAILEKLAASEKPFKVVIRYDSGKVREIPCHSDKSAQNCARGESRRIGLPLIDREGNTVRITSVEVE